MSLSTLLACPDCRSGLELDSLSCQGCGRQFTKENGILSLLPRHLTSSHLHDHVCEISLLVMTRNEGLNIAEQLKGSRRVLDSLGVSYEVIVIDGNSQDDTVEQARSQGARVEQQRQPGYGCAFRQGLGLCRGESILTLDADGSHDPNFIRAVWAHRHAAELVIASRYAGGDAQMPRSRLLLSLALNRFLGAWLSVRVLDLSSGYRLYRRSALQDIELKGRDFDVLIELLVKLCCRGYNVREIPFFYKPRGSGRSKVALLRFAQSYLGASINLWKLRNSRSAADYDSRAYRSFIYPQRYWQQQRFRLVTQMLDGANENILDIGCGSSKIIQFLPGAVGLDKNLAKLRFLRRIHPQLVHGDLRALPFNEASFDTVIASQVLQYLPQTKDALNEALRVLKPGGRLILSVPDYGRASWPLIATLYQRLVPNAEGEPHTGRLKRDQLVSLAADLGATLRREDNILGAEWIGMFRTD